MRAELRAAAQRLDPSPLALRRVDGALPRLRLAMVYRARNASRVRTFLNALPPQVQVRLWALDAVAPELAAATAGSGPGTRFELLNRALADLPADDGTWTVVVDDDVRFRIGDLALLVRAAHAAGLDVAQPAHVAGSHVSHEITERCALSVVREVWYVEQGPLVLFSPVASVRFLPLPEDVGMGWGIEYVWSAARADGLRLGIVDAVGIEHLSPPATEYDIEAARAGGHRLREAYGFASGRDLMMVTGVWRPWRTAPPWLPPAERDRSHVL